MIAENNVDTADGVIKAAGGNFISAVLTAGTGAAATLDLYDHASAASGSKIVPTIRAPQGETVVVVLPPVPFINGCYADVGGSGAEYSVQVD